MNEEQTTPTPEKEPYKSPLRQIRTFQGDVAESLKKQNESLISIQQSEAERRRTAQANAPEEARGWKKSVLLAIGTLVLIALGGVGGWFAYNEYVRQNTPPPSEIPESRLITAREDAIFDITDLSRSELIKKVTEASTPSLDPTEVRHLVATAGTSTPAALATTREFFDTLDTGAPSALLRSFDDIYMLAVLGQDVKVQQLVPTPEIVATSTPEEQVATSTATTTTETLPPVVYTPEPYSTFIIIELNSFENAFAGMLSWEETMARDIGPIFSTAKLLKNIPAQTQFDDVIYRNKDVRVIYDDLDIPVLLYSFLNNEILIITDRLETLETIISRLTSERLSR